MEIVQDCPAMTIDASTAILFDLDGVLIDSRTAISRCINHALDAHGLPERPSIRLSGSSDHG